MPAAEEYSFVSEMLRDNGGCRLPCWWGFTPGETLWQTAEAFFVSMGKTIWHYPQTSYTVFYDIPDRQHDHYQNYFVEDGIIDMIEVAAAPPVGEDGDYAYGDPRFAEDWKSYMLPQILEAYGLPQQIFLETYKSGPDRLPFRLLLFYPDPGFLVNYEGPTGEDGRGAWVEAGEAIHFCPWRSDVTLSLWSSERAMTFADLVPVIDSLVNPDRLRSLEEATGMSIEQFYQTFAQPGNQTCLETPADMW
jgi:hypothetical protein